MLTQLLAHYYNELLGNFSEAEILQEFAEFIELNFKSYFQFK